MCLCYDRLCFIPSLFGLFPAVRLWILSCCMSTEPERPPTLWGLLEVLPPETLYYVASSSREGVWAMVGSPWCRVLPPCTCSSVVLIMLSILLNPGPYLAMRSFGSLKGRRFQTMYSAFYPSRFTMSFSHEAQFTGPYGFLVNMALSSRSTWVSLSFSYDSRSFLICIKTTIQVLKVIRTYILLNAVKPLPSLILISIPAVQLCQKLIDFVKKSLL